MIRNDKKMQFALAAALTLGTSQNGLAFPLPANKVQEDPTPTILALEVQSCTTKQEENPRLSQKVIVSHIRVKAQKRLLDALQHWRISDKFRESLKQGITQSAKDMSPHYFQYEKGTFPSAQISSIGNAISNVEKTFKLPNTKLMIDLKVFVDVNSSCTPD